MHYSSSEIQNFMHHSSKETQSFMQLSIPYKLKVSIHSSIHSFKKRNSKFPFIQTYIHSKKRNSKFPCIHTCISFRQM